MKNEVFCLIYFIYNIIITILCSGNLFNFSNSISLHKQKDSNLLMISRFNNSSYHNIHKKVKKNSNYTIAINEIEVLKSKFDHRKFYSFELENGLKTYVIQDNETKLEGAGMLVGAGSVMDGDLLGLAHFTEHMLFLGSKKYSNATYFVDYITLRHGQHNGKTRVNSSMYYFKIDKTFFREGFDIFSRFFIDPLLSSSNIEKEINSVNSEYLKNQQVDTLKKDHVIRKLANKDSFYHRFRTGNNETLLVYSKTHNLNLTKVLRNYFDEYYVPNNMILVIYGSKDVKHYSKIVKRTFSKLRKKNFTEIIENSPPFNFFEQGNITFYNTIKENKELEVNILIPQDFFVYKNSSEFLNPTLFLKFLLNRKVNGSLTDVLRTNGFATSTKSTLKNLYNTHLVFRTIIFLTDKGVKNLFLVIQVLFDYLLFLKDNSLKDDELYNLVKGYYDFKFFSKPNKRNIIETIKTFTGKISEYPDKFILSQHKLMNNYETERDNILNLLNYFTLNNSIILFGNKNFETNLFEDYSKFLEDFNEKVILKENEQFLNTYYGTYRIINENLPEFSSLFESNNLTSSFSLDEFLGLFKTRGKRSKTNSNICHNKKCKKKLKMDAKNLAPRLLVNDSISEVWYKLDRSFLKKKVVFYLRLIFPFDINELRFTISIRLLEYILTNKIRTIIKNEIQQNAQFECIAQENGILIKISSSTEKLPFYLKEFLSSFKNLNITEEEFSLSRDEMKNKYEKLTQLLPKFKGIYDFNSIVLKDYTETEEILNYLSELKFTKFEPYVNDVLLKENIYSKVLFYGNFDKESANKLYNSEILPFLNNNHTIIKNKNFTFNLNYKNYINLHANISGYHIFQKQLSDNHNVDHAILNFYQIGPDNITNLIKIYLIKKIVGYVYFTELRIKEQLGYSTKGKVFSEDGILYFLITVQGSRFSPDIMDKKIENVISIMKDRIISVSARKFKKYKRILFKVLGRKDKTLGERADRIWRELISHRKYFNMKQEIKKHKKVFNKNNLIQFFKNIFETHLKKLSVQEFSKNVILEDQNKDFQNITRRNITLNYTPNLITDINYFRKKKKYLNLN